MVDSCFKCGKKLCEEDLELSHDIPKYMGGTDLDGRHYLCHECHQKYELEVLKFTLMNLIKSKFPEDWKYNCRISAHIVKGYFFKEDKNNNGNSKQT
jgi:5-methylcytosine-specific restriction endonuclease McrA